MIDLDIVSLLRLAADEYENVIRRNRELDKDINELKRQYNEDMNKIRSTPSPRISKSTVVLSPRQIREMSEKLEDEKKKLLPPPVMVIAALNGISKRANSVLYRARVIRVSDFHRLTLARLAKIKGCGKVTMKEIEAIALRCGHTLK